MDIPVKHEPSEFKAEIQPYIDGGAINYAMEWTNTFNGITDNDLQPSDFTQAEAQWSAKLDELQDKLIIQNNLIQEIMELVEKLLIQAEGRNE